MEDDFTARATDLGAQVHRVGSQEQAVALIVDVLRASGSRGVILSPDLEETLPNLRGALRREGARLVEGGSTGDAAQADMGVTGAALGIAETGSIVLAAEDMITRLASMLPLVHVAILNAAALVPSLDEAGELLQRSSVGAAGTRVRYVSLVSGPSRTSDVEKTLTVGVHGPGQLHVVLVSEP